MSRVEMDQYLELGAMCKSGRITPAIFTRLMENPDRYDPNLGRFGRLYPTTVNRDLGFDKLLKQADQNGGMNNGINSKSFPIKGKGVRNVVLELYEFDQTVGCATAGNLIEDDGYELEDLPEGLAFAKANPLEQLRRPIVILGKKSRWQSPDGICFPCFRWNGGQRGLYLHGLDDDLYPRFQILVSRKKK